jgi:hypothetical protein
VRFTLDTNVLVYAVDKDAGDRHRIALDLVRRARQGLRHHAAGAGRAVPDTDRKRQGRTSRRNQCCTGLAGCCHHLCC